MSFMKIYKTIAYIKRSHNLFTLYLAMPGQIMLAISKKMAISSRAHLTHLVGKNKYIYFWHQQLAHVSNAQVIKTFNLVKNINLGFIKKYNLIELFVDLGDLNNFNDNSWMELTVIPQLTSEQVMYPSFVYQIRTDNNGNNLLNKLCISYVGSKLMQVTQKNKNMTSTFDKLEEIQANLWGPYKLLS